MRFRCGSHSSAAAAASWRRRRRPPGQSIMNLLLMLLFLPTLASALRCAQCSGWHGNHPLETTVSNTCDNRNNQCQSDQFCVKIIDPMAPGISYVTFKSDCWFQTTIQVTPSNLTSIVDSTCYTYQDSSVPSKRWTYCFCSDRDYCNSARLSFTMFSLVLGFIFYL